MNNNTIIHYRRVVNDAVVYPWEEMPEIYPPTLYGLVEFIKTCPGWDYRLLSLEHQGWNKHQVSYGPRALFWIPEIPNPDCFIWLDQAED